MIMMMAVFFLFLLLIFLIFFFSIWAKQHKKKCYSNHLYIILALVHFPFVFEINPVFGDVNKQNAYIYERMNEWILESINETIQNENVFVRFVRKGIFSLDGICDITMQH